MTESKRSELRELIFEKARQHKTKWFERWGEMYEEFKEGPTLESAVDLLGSNPPAGIADEFRNYILNQPKRPRGKPKKPDSFYLWMAYIFEDIQADNPKKNELWVFNKIVEDFFSAEKPDGEVEPDTVRKWRDKGLNIRQKQAARKSARTD